MEKFSKNIDGIRNMLKDLKSEKYAIVNPELIALDEYVKGLYLKVLCTVIQYENDPSEMQILYLRRIVNGISIDDTSEECMRKALEISTEDMQEFLSIMGKLNCKYYFAVDGIILSSLGKGNAPSYDYLAEILELLEINKADLEFICMITKSILQQDSSFYNQAKNLVNERVEKLDFAPYIYNYYAGAIVDTDIEKHYSAPDKKLSYDIEYVSDYKEKIVVFENLEIELGFDWSFKGCEKVIFRNCTLIGATHCMKFDSVGSLVFDSCTIKDFSNGVAYIVSSNQIIIETSEFISCGRTGDGDFRGGMFLISGNRADSILIQNNKFHACYVAARTYRYNYGVTGVLMNFDGDSRYAGEFKIINNEFTGCDCTNNGNYTAALISNFYNNNNAVNQDNRYSGNLQRLFE